MEQTASWTIPPKVEVLRKPFISNWRECDKPSSVRQCKSRLIQTACAAPDQSPLARTRRPALSELSSEPWPRKPRCLWRSSGGGDRSDRGKGLCGRGDGPSGAAPLRGEVNESEIRSF